MKNILFTLAILFSLSLSSQTIVGSNNVVIINNGGSSSDDQQLTLVGNTLTLENGGTVDLSGYLDNKNVASGSLSGTTLTLTLTDSSTVVIDLTGLGGGGSSITTKDEGVTLTTGTTEYNFTGAGVTASNSSGAVTVNVPGGSVSGNNPNITIVETLAEITSAGEGAAVLIIEPIVLTSDYSPPANQHWIIDVTGSIDLGPYAITGDIKVTLPPKGNIGLNMFNSDQKINHKDVLINITNKEMYASNFGAIDDNNPATDNFVVGRNMIHIANINSGHLVWDKQDTGKYWSSVTLLDPFTNGQSPFYPFDNYTTGWVVGDGNDGVTIEHEGDVEIITITNDSEVSRRYVFFNTTNSKIKGGTLRGDRYRHRYNRLITVTQGASTNGNIVIHWEEKDPYVSITVTANYDITVPLTAGTADSNATQIANYINANLSGYVASASGNVVTFYKEGNDFEFLNSNTIEPGNTGATFTAIDSPYEWGHGIFYYSRANYCNVENVHITEFHGDGIASDFQGNGGTAINAEHMSTGNIDENGNITGSSGYRYLTTIRNLPNPHPWFALEAGVWQTFDLKHFKYWLALYDSNDNFVYKTKPLVPYAKYEIRRGEDGQVIASKYRLIVEYNGPDNFSGFNYLLRSRSYQEGAVIDQVEISHCRRQGISNPPLLHLKITNSKIHNTGGQEPNFGIDLEDYQKAARGWVIENCEFWNNGNGDIIVKGASHGRIVNNFFKQDSWAVRTFFSQGNAIGTSYGRQITISGNMFEHKRIDADIDVNVSGNIFWYSDVVVSPGGNIVTGNTFDNGFIHDGSKTGGFSASGAEDLRSIVSDNYFKISDDWGNRRLIDEANSILWKDNVWEFNTRSPEHAKLEDPSYEEVLVTSNVNNWIAANRNTSPTGHHNGITMNEIVNGLKTAPEARTRYGWSKYANNIRGLYVKAPLVIQNGYTKSFHIKDAEVWRLDMDLNEFTSAGGGDYETIRVVDAIIKVPDQLSANTGWLDNTGAGSGNQTAYTRHLVNIAQDKDVNLVFDNVIFDYGTNPSGLFLYLGHRGTTTFRNCTFRADSAQTIDFTSSGTRGIGTATGPNTGVITIINPIKENVSFVLRGGDSEN